MGKEKIAEEGSSNIMMQYIPILIGLVCIIFCYLLYKKVQTLNSQSDSITNLEKHFTQFIKDQAIINTTNTNKFNSLGNQTNQLNYILQNKNQRDVNNISTQMSPDNKNKNTESILKEANTRELMPTVTISTIKNEINDLPKPISTTNKKTVKIDNIETYIDTSAKKNIDLETLQEEVLIEEASSDED